MTQYLMKSFFPYVQTSEKNKVHSNNHIQNKILCIFEVIYLPQYIYCNNYHTKVA